MDVVADHNLFAVFANGQLAPVRLRIGRPMPHPKGDWACPVDVDGLQIVEGSTEIFGVGLGHALMLGLRFLREILSSEVQRGTVFHDEEGKHAINIERLFVLYEIAKIVRRVIKPA
jgi:Domain of unknown function (DUF6968)